jgi:hypothetical protein
MKGMLANQVWINLVKFFMVIIIILQQKFGHEYDFHYGNACTPPPSPPPPSSYNLNNNTFFNTKLFCSFCHTE